MSVKITLENEHYDSVCVPKTIGERFDEMAEAAGVSKTDKSYDFGRSCCFQIATDQKAIDEANPSDAVIMRILNAIGYEEESWIPIVRENLEAMEE